MFYFFIFSIGTILASGLTCYWQRGWYNFIAINRRSHCLHCQKVLRYWQLIPLVGWLVQKGRCHYCQQSIDLIYLIMECFGGLWAIVIFFQIDHPEKLIILGVTGLLMARLIFLDITTYRLSRIYTLVIGVLGCYCYGQWLTSLCLGTSFLLIKISYQWRGKKNVLGLGDVKLGYALGLWLPLNYIAAFYITTGMMGIVWGYLWCQQYKTKIFPFAPCLLLSFTCLYLYKIASSN